MKYLMVAVFLLGGCATPKKTHTAAEVQAYEDRIDAYINLSRKCIGRLNNAHRVIERLVEAAAERPECK